MADGKHIAGRFFVVGCPRSGTTLLQTMLASHPRVFSLPETQFFIEARGHLWRNRVLKLAASRSARKVLFELLEHVDRRDLHSMVPGLRPFLNSYARAFRDILDKVTLDHGKDMWVEKSPRHLHHITQIQRAIPDAGLIHILRDGRDVVASLCEASWQAPEMWGMLDIDDCIERWNQDIQLSLAKAGQPQHFALLYEDLLEDPKGQLMGLCRFLGLPFEDTMLSFQEAARDVVPSWASRSLKRKNFEPLQDTRRQKFKAMFTEDQQRYVAQHLLFHGDVRGHLRPASEGSVRLRGQGKAL